MDLSECSVGGEVAGFGCVVESEVGYLDSEESAEA